MFTKLQNIQKAGIFVYAGYLLYYIGRRFLEGYNEVLGIPPQYHQYSFHDYIYYGFHPIQLLMGIVFISLFFGIIKFWNASPEQINDESLAGLGFWRKFWIILTTKEQREKWFGIGFFFYEFPLLSIGLLILLILWIFIPPTTQSNMPEKLPLAAITIMFLLVICTLSLIAIWWDQYILSILKRFKFLKFYFLSINIALLFILPHLGGLSWGIYSGSIDTQISRIQKVFPSVNITAESKIPGIDWTADENGYYESTDKLYLMLENEDSLILKKPGEHFSHDDNPPKFGHRSIPV